MAIIALKRPEQNRCRSRIVARLALVSHLLHQQPKGAGKIYALHEPEVDCISKGKSRVRYELGRKASIATTPDEGFVLGMRSFPGNPYDGHTLKEALEQVATLTDQRPELAVVDRGYRGHGEDKSRVLISGTRRGLTPKLIADLRRRSAIDAEIGHMKTDGRLLRCPPEGHHRGCLVCRALRLRPQHPQDPGLPQGFPCLDHRRLLGYRKRSATALSGNGYAGNALFRVNKIGKFSTGCDN